MTKRNIFILGLCFLGSLYSDMRIEKQLIHLFRREPVPTEESAYRELMKNPVIGNQTYVAIPWVVLLNHKGLSNVRKTKVNNGFTICQHIHFRKIIPVLKEMGIQTLFSPHAEEDEIDGIKIVPFPHVPNNGCPPAKKKDLLFSFIGRQTHSCRKDIFELPKSSQVVIKQIKGAAKSSEFRQLLARSRFSLCPRGTGPSSIRFWESLQAGAIPIIIADAMRLPPNFDWSKCVIRVPENEIAMIPSILEKVTPKQEAEMRQACYQAHELFSKRNITSVVHHYFSKL